MSLFVLDEFEMAVSQLEKLMRKRKAEAKHYKCIMEEPKLHNVCGEKCRKQYAAPFEFLRFDNFR